MKKDLNIYLPDDYRLRLVEKSEILRAILKRFYHQDLKSLDLYEVHLRLNHNLRGVASLCDFLKEACLYADQTYGPGEVRNAREAYWRMRPVIENWYNQFVELAA